MRAILSNHSPIARYGDFQVLFDLDFELHAGEVVALTGANGAGKSILPRSIMGLLPVGRQMVQFDGAYVGDQPPHLMVQKALAMLPDGRRLFTGISVEDNLRVAMDHACTTGPQTWTLAGIYTLFPMLKEKRRAPVESLSGGQQQMVAIRHGLLCQPRVLLCDEISLGLAPKVIREIYAALPEITAAGTAMILVEQDVSLAKSASNRLYCMLEGRFTLRGNSKDIARGAIAAAYFGAAHAVD